MTGDHPYSIDAARAAAARDELADWVAEFLASPGSDNAPLADKLSDEERWWIGPIELPISKLSRLAGPPGDPVLVPLAEDDWRDDVQDLADKIDEGELTPPPVVVTYRDEQLLLEDGNHRVEALRRTGEDTAWAIVAFLSEAERDRFLAAAPS